jgi:hypothetical protein
MQVAENTRSPTYSHPHGTIKRTKAVFTHHSVPQHQTRVVEKFVRTI